MKCNGRFARYLGKTFGGTFVSESWKGNGQVYVRDAIVGCCADDQ